MDITIGDPTYDSYITEESHKIKLKTAAEKHKDKMELHKKRVDELGLRDHRSNGGGDAKVVGQDCE